MKHHKKLQNLHNTVFVLIHRSVPIYKFDVFTASRRHLNIHFFFQRNIPKLTLIRFSFSRTLLYIGDSFFLARTSVSGRRTCCCIFVPESRASKIVKLQLFVFQKPLDSFDVWDASFLSTVREDFVGVCALKMKSFTCWQIVWGKCSLPSFRTQVGAKQWRPQTFLLVQKRKKKTTHTGHVHSLLLFLRSRHPMNWSCFLKVLHFFGQCSFLMIVVGGLILLLSKICLFFELCKVWNCARDNKKMFTLSKFSLNKFSTFNKYA